jgi:hypothetical protein
MLVACPASVSVLHSAKIKSGVIMEIQLHVNTLGQGCNCDLCCDIKIFDIYAIAIDGASNTFGRDYSQYQGLQKCPRYNFPYVWFHDEYIKITMIHRDFSKAT